MYGHFSKLSLAAWVLCAVARLAPAAESAGSPDSLVAAVAQAGMAEVAAARLAVDASGSNAVKELAYRLIQDHERMRADLELIAQKRGIDLPAALDPEHAARLQALKEASAQDFDARYLAQTILAHAKLADLLRENLLNPDSGLAVFSSYNLPRVMGHKRVAEDLTLPVGKVR